MSRPERWLLALAVIVATGTLAVGLGRTDLWPPNETRVAEISREMLAGGSWWVPHLNGRPFLEEPPLFYWLQAGLYRIAGGPSALAARIPAAAGGIVGVVVTVVLARAVGANAAVAALVLATAPEWWWMARTATPDTANAAATAGALVALYAARESGSSAMLALAVAGAAAAFWLKSFLGIGLGVATAIAFLALAGRGRLSRRQLAGAGLALAALVASWLLVVSAAEGRRGLRFFLVKNHLGRLLGHGGHGHLRPVDYYARNLVLDVLPWSIALPAAFATAWRSRRDVGRLFPIVWAAVMTLLLTVSATKTAHYLLPAYPAFAVLVARWWSEAGDRALDRLTWIALAATFVVVFPAATLVLTTLDPATAISRLADASDRISAAIGFVLEARIGALAWWAVPVFALGVAVVLVRRTHRPLAAVAAATSGVAVHLLTVAIALPAFDRFVSARPIGEALGRVADAGVSVFTHGFDNREAVSPFMFYARRTFPEASSKDDLERQLASGPACALLPAEAYERVAHRVPTLPAVRRTLGARGLVLLSGSAGGCPADGAT
jgi:4-amino-4-deoxy-L-arabinose transferase-like glycosyltransferase